MEKLIQHISFIGGGILLTLQLLIGGILIGLLFGTLLAILRYNNIASNAINRFISIIRGTPH